MELEVKVPSVGESITEVTIANWLKNDGEEVDMDEVICEIESDKATFELSAESAGVLHIKVGEGETVDVGSVIASINTAGATTESTKPMATTSPETEAKPASQEKPASKSSDKDHYASGTPSPAAQKILSEKDISPESVSGTGRDGRITKEDAMKAEASKATPAKEAAAPSKPTTPAPASTMTGKRETRSERMSSLRSTIARRLVEVKNTTAMLTTFNEVDMTAIMEIRKKYKENFKEKHGIGLGFMSFFTKAVTEAMKDFPDINAKIDGDEIVYHDYADIGIAVSTPRGLVVPVIRNAESLSLAGIEKEVMNLALKARDNKISIEEMQGGTFTITNGGVFGSLLSTPIINSPQSAILGMHNIVERPMAINGQVVIRPMMYVALSYDHRIVDGKESVGFLVKVKQMLEDPNRLLLEV